MRERIYMKEFVSKILSNDEKFKILIVCLTYESLLGFINDIEKEIPENLFMGKILIDQLLATGNGKNRFLSFDFLNKSIIISSAKNEIIGDNYRKASSRMLKSSKRDLFSSVLSFKQAEMIKNGQFI